MDFDQPGVDRPFQQTLTEITVEYRWKQREDVNSKSHLLTAFIGQGEDRTGQKKTAVDQTGIIQTEIILQLLLPVRPRMLLPLRERQA